MPEIIEPIVVTTSAPTTEITTETTPVETTTETTTVTTTVTTAEATTTETTTVTTATTPETTVTTAQTTTATTTKEPEVTYSAPVASVLPGEYTYGGAPTIETIDGFTYVNGILIANKTYSMPDTFDPGYLNPDAYAAFEQMKSAAANDGITLKIISGYRSYSHQTRTYNRYVSRDGQAAADRYSARPGHSEHQTGLAMDINSLEQSFGETPEGIWLAEHCAEYGFIIRYPKEKEVETGFMYEPWHIRYLGKDIAAAVKGSGLCLEEYLGITSVYQN
ncbi:MAG: M15 family metallopeptidase [Clostridia bacterium]|nr:M15 family metallopeptidase [Clostridia bacterium]